jgi:hypothetical protein
MTSIILLIFLLLGVFSTYTDEQLIEHTCEITLSIIDQLDDISVIVCSWENVANIHNFYSKLINHNKEILNYIDDNGDNMNKMFEQYYNAVNGDDCFKLAILNKRLIRYLNRSYNKNC